MRCLSSEVAATRQSFSLMALSAGSQYPRKRSWRERVSLLGILAGLAGAIAAGVFGRLTGAGSAASLGLAVVLGVGLYLLAADEKKTIGDLGEGIVVSAVVA